MGGKDNFMEDVCFESDSEEWLRLYKSGKRTF